MGSANLLGGRFSYVHKLRFYIFERSDMGFGGTEGFLIADWQE